MTGYDFFLDFWWILPLVAMAFCLYFGNKFGMGSMCSRRTTDFGDQPDLAEDLLNKRYAQGKIDQKEYEEIKRALKVT